MKSIVRYIDSIKQDIEFKVGANAQENFDLIDASKPQDLWFHISANPSCHVVACLPEDLGLDKKQLLKVATQGAVICKQHSKQKSDKDVAVVYCRIENVTKSEVKVGSVIITNEKIIKI